MTAGPIFSVIVVYTLIAVGVWAWLMRAAAAGGASWGQLAISAPILFPLALLWPVLLVFMAVVRCPE